MYKFMYILQVKKIMKWVCGCGSAELVARKLPGNVEYIIPGNNAGDENVYAHEKPVSACFELVTVLFVNSFLQYRAGTEARICHPESVRAVIEYLHQNSMRNAERGRVKKNC